MYTECPSCSTLFKVTPDQLKVAKGQVRCGRCDHVFDALAALIDDLPEDEQSATQDSQVQSNSSVVSKQQSEAADPSSVIDGLDELNELEDFAAGLGFSSEVELDATPSEASEVFDLDDGDSRVAATDDSPLNDAVKEQESGFSSFDEMPQEVPEAEKKAKKDAAKDYILEELGEKKADGSQPVAKTSVALWGSIIVLLIIVLFGQLIFFKRDTLANFDWGRPLVQGVCSVVGLVTPCEVPPKRDLAAIELTERDVRSHPTVKGALHISATIRNTADFDQPYPTLELVFSDTNNHVLAKREFVASQYLGAEVDPAAGMAKGVPIVIQLEIVDPGPEAVNFQFNFH